MGKSPVFVFFLGHICWSIHVHFDSGSTMGRSCLRFGQDENRRVGMEAHGRCDFHVFIL